MIRHIVLFRLRPEISAGQLDELMDALRALKDTIPEIRSFEVARDEIGSERSASFGILSSFDDFDALRRYQQHPDHQELLSRILLFCEWVRAWDYTLDG
ncbi:MAG: hypothetical protein KatS3mg057_1143 [Herpetosiphonaceae bacterium]|nr:MAG: hypothetical protein KatS3mg057_1143 [Herpetosiphonaceae bacterium]